MSRGPFSEVAWANTIRPPGTLAALAPGAETRHPPRIARDVRAVFGSFTPLLCPLRGGRSTALAEPLQPAAPPLLGQHAEPGREQAADDAERDQHPGHG